MARTGFLSTVFDGGLGCVCAGVGAFGFNLNHVHPDCTENATVVARSIAMMRNVRRRVRFIERFFRCLFGCARSFVDIPRAILGLKNCFEAGDGVWQKLRGCAMVGGLLVRGAFQLACLVAIERRQSCNDRVRVFGESFEDG